MTRTRDDFVKECPAFGLDAEGKPGIDESSKSCQYCAANDGAMHDACKDECDGAGEIAEEPAAAIETPAIIETMAPVTAKAGKKPKKERAAKVSKAPKEKKAKKEKVAKAPKAERGPTMMDAIIDVLRTGPKKTKEIVDLIIAAGFAKAAATTQLSMALSFGRRVGVIIEQDGGWILKV